MKTVINEKILKFFRNGKLNNIPKKYEYRQAILYFFYSLFEDREYNEKEVNEIIKGYYDDFVVIRRYLIDYKFLMRDKKGLIYIKNPDKYMDLEF